MKNGIALGILLLVPLLPAQGRPEHALLPKGAFLVAEAAGPSQLAKSFRGTKWGAFFADERLRKAAAESVPTWELVVQGVLEDAAPVVLGLLTAYWNFPGRVTFGLGWDASGGDGGVQWSAVFGAAPEAELEALRAALTKLLPDRRSRALTLGDQEVQVVRLGTNGWATKPVAIGGVLAMFGGSAKVPGGDLGGSLRGASAAVLTLSEAPISVHFDGRRALSVLTQDVFESARAGTVDPKKMLRALGADALAHVNVTVAPDGDRVRSELAIQLDVDAPHGIFRLWTEAGGAEPATRDALLARVPNGHALWSLARVRMDLVPAFLRDVLAAAGPAAPWTYEEGVAKATEFLKVDLEKEILARLGGDVLTLQNMNDDAPELPGEGDFRQEMRLQQAFGTCLVLAIKEGAAFGKALDKMLRARGLHASRKSESVAGTKVYSMNLLGALPVHYAVTDEHFYFALGDHAGNDLKAALTSGARTDAASRPSLISPALAREIAAMPLPVLGFGAERTNELIESLVRQMQEELADPDAEDAELMRSLMLPIVEAPLAMRRVKLEASVGVIGGSRDRILWRWVQ